MLAAAEPLIQRWLDSHSVPVSRQGEARYNRSKSPRRVSSDRRNRGRDDRKGDYPSVKRTARRSRSRDRARRSRSRTPILDLL